MVVTPALYPSLGRYDVVSRTDDRKQLSDDQWFLIEDLFPWEPPTRLGGRPPIPPRAVLEGLLWMLRNGGPWKDLPEYFPSEATCRRRLREWTESGILIEVWSRLVELSDELGCIDWEQLIADGTFCRARKGGVWWESATRAKAPPRLSSWITTARRWPW
jgi:transposase